MKSYTTAFILCLFLGFFGVHKFYQGKIGLGILYLFTGGLFGIGWFVDTIVLLVKLIKNEPYPQLKQFSAQANIEVEPESWPINSYIAGVKYDNEDGTSRQDAVKKLQEDDTVNLVASLFEGNPAIEVHSLDGEMLGYIPNKHKDTIYPLMQAGRVKQATVSSFYYKDNIKYVDLDIYED